MLKINRMLRKIRDREEGSVIILTAFMLVILIGFISLVLDIGKLYLIKNKLQTAADMGAAAAVRQVNLSELKINPGARIKIDKIAATRVANEYAKANIDPKLTKMGTIRITVVVKNNPPYKYDGPHVTVSVSAVSTNLPLIEVLTGKWGDGIRVSGASTADLTEAHY